MYRSEARSWSNIPLCRTWQQFSLREGEIGSYRGNWHQVGSLVTGETSMPLTAPLIRTITSLGLGQVCRKVSQWVGCRWSRHWSSRGCRETKRRAILRSLTIYLSSLHYCFSSRILFCLIPTWWSSSYHSDCSWNVSYSDTTSHSLEGRPSQFLRCYPILFSLIASVTWHFCLKRLWFLSLWYKSHESRDSALFPSVSPTFSGAPDS